MKADDDFRTNEELIEATAATWFIENEGGLTPEQAKKFEQWKKADPRHAAACARFSRSAEIVSKWPLLAEVPTGTDSMESVAAKRRWGYPALLAFAGVAAVFALALGGWWVQTHADVGANRFATGTGGYQRATLDDGSMIELNAESEVRVLFSESERRIVLVRGEAYFAVAKNQGRPFIVAKESIAVTAVGTAFSVKAQEARVSVLVTEGKVQLGRESSSERNAARVPLGAGESASVATDRGEFRPEIAKVEFAAMRDALDWRQPKLVFSNTPLSEVVAQFNLRNQIQISIEDESLALRPVAGTFRADNVAAFVRLLEQHGEVSVERRDHARFILRRPEPAPAAGAKRD